ncbi:MULTISPECIES: DUF1684 domain-containing protein [Emticicia]|uniref:DUF1684 domain-containing protein n=1 Tax=Emticicia TaxID=312278 RepID=UPI00209DA3CF|nr:MULTISPECIES: DUF1684 domain-containing protein [Emticicia]UTA66934.1 DUF1684 domain-containing protein [Emticicia sp. 21SJ11W-3]
MNKYIKCLALLLPLAAFSFVVETPYETSIKSWQQKRIENLKSEEGWLNLAGLFWLEEGENTIGGDKKNSIVFPADHSAPFIGKIILKKGQITFEAAPNAVVLQGNDPILETTLFPYNGFKPTVLKHKTLRWFIIQRGDKYAIRLRDLEGEYLLGFKGIETFPINEAWKVKTRFVPTEGKKLSITDITGRTYEQDSPGKLVFTLDGKEYSLAATGKKERLHVVFSDATSKHETYGAGRFLDAEAPDAEGNIYLDFNKAYNPPCAFTPYATCPLPVKENQLTVAIKAGEKYSGNH